MPEMMGGEKQQPATAASSSSPAWECGSPLYDAFELASVYGVLDSHLMALPFARRSPSRDGGGRAAAARNADIAVVAAGSGRRTTTVVARRASRRRRAATTTRRTGMKAVLHSICRSVTCSRKL
ncbi:hypothetical protein QOZ80_5BG0410690 [Eleusine coracana subsp. coracana]|nr:hypothetical protein QOZ80_5BG0410690 [Eleusine coracana subsp. coracana]